ncbi:M-phase phosphoprotein 6 [Stegostoma tigrinum]|uniref:M-phase phosphoprotein 6 n=1 Tax=Stegostoma tigrinum TaxID=3053191 RepID=UPI00202B5F8F|nr:M-phase phosphoprotein 6 [Stegostoma tigrinum]
MARESAMKLSKNLLKMKFMQRSLDTETKKQLEEEEKKIISDEHWYLDLPELKEKESHIIEEKSFVPCEEMLFGRMSFKGFNPEIEKLVAQMYSQNENEEPDEDVKMEVDVSDVEMARRYESLVGTIKRKFTKKRDRSAIQTEETEASSRGGKCKKTFIKPQE